MAEFTRTRGGVGVEGYVNGVNTGTAWTSSVGSSLKFYIITVKNVSNSAQDLQPEMAAGGNGTEGGTGLAVEAILRACPSVLSYYVPADSSGNISLICDGVNAPAATDLQLTLRALGTSVGTNTMDVSHTVVADGASFTVA
jgi:hypothetical protein